MTRKYVKERKAFGQSISQFQTIQHRLAELKTEISVGRAFSDQCLQLHKEKRLDASMASMCKLSVSPSVINSVTWVKIGKYWITDLQGKVIDSCVQLHGVSTSSASVGGKNHTHTRAPERQRGLEMRV